MAKFSLEVQTSDDEAPTLQASKPAESYKNFTNYLRKLVGGARTGSATVTSRSSLVPADGTITLASCAAGTIVEVNGVPFKAIAGTVVAANDEFDIDGTNDEDATDLARAINASTNAAIDGILTASAASNVVTVTAVNPGAVGNGVTIKTLGVVANGNVTCLGADADDTVTINGTVFTAKQQRATGTITCSNVDPDDYCAIDGTTFTASAGTTISMTADNGYWVTLADTDDVNVGDVLVQGSILARVAEKGPDGSNLLKLTTDETWASVPDDVQLLTTEQFYSGGTDTVDAASLVFAINAHANLTGRVTATNSSGVVTVRAVTAGTAANAYALTTSDGTDLAVSDTTLLGGIAVANNQFEVTGTNTQVATDLCRAINASSTALVSSHVRATSSATVVTLHAKYPGLAGNAITLASSEAVELAVLPGARLTGGTDTSSEGVKATGTVTITGADGGAYAIVINGVSIGGTGTNGDDNATAATMCAAIQASTNALVQGHISASVATNVVTITALRGGVSGNNITLTTTGTGSVASVSRLATGAVPTTVVLSAERLASGAETLVTFDA